MSQKKLQQAISLHAQGDVLQAAALFRRVLKLEPANAVALHGLGMIAAELGEFAESVRVLGRLVGMHPGDAALRNNYANALRASGDREAALGQYAEAIRLQPDYARAWSNRGAVFNEIGRNEDALASFEEALRHEPGSADVLYNRANVLHDLGRPHAALESYAQALHLEPEHAAAWRNQGELLADLGRHGEALASFDRALALDTGHAQAWAHRGGVLNELKHPAAALESCDRAIVLEAAYFGAWWNGAIACMTLKRYEQALRYFRRALERKPDIDYGPGQCLLSQLMVCEWKGLEVLRQEIAAEIAQGRKVATPFVALAAAFSPELQKACAEIYVADRFLAATSTADPALPGARSRIRIGYVSGDLRSHPVGYQTRGLARFHDRTAFEVIGLSLRKDDADPAQRELRGMFDQFHDLDALQGAEAIARIRALDLDIAVDLQGHLDGARTGLFAGRIAPLQVNFLCPGTSGASYIDYIVADASVIPEREHAAYTEKIVLLPDSFFVTDYHHLRLAPPPSRASQGLPESGFVFASFCESYKISPRIWDVWMRLLREMPDSILWLGVRGNDIALKNLREAAASSGVAPARLLVSTFAASRIEHLSRLALADLCLDTPGYNGHTTTADALWAGVPVLTTPGAGFSARVAASLVRAVGLPEMVVDDMAQYEARAKMLAREPGQLATLRAKLAEQRLTQPLFDTRRTVRLVESAYRHMQSRHRAGAPAASFVVEN